ncbi:MAG: SIS domain-containing protein [Candidatus Marinimicrobia bacterium]|nr:SIS domain-containing protein [Candidatus Neomarinimicrobiota bacterium]
MNNPEFIQSFLKDTSDHMQISDTIHSDLVKLAELLLMCSSDNKKVIIAGNGASSSISSHISIDLTKGAGIKCINFNEPNLITCFSNDYGYKRWVEKAVKAYGDPGDVFIAISSSGQSENILNGCSAARGKKFQSVITLSGFNENNPLRQLGDINFWVDSNNYNVIENVHQIWLLSVVELIINEKKSMQE